LLPPRWWALAIDALSRLYWVALTDRRLILVRYLGSENRPVFERALPRAGLRVVRDYESRLNRELKLEADEWKARLRFWFPLASKGDAEAFVSAIQNRGVS
jgi:hypothetical protein